MPTVQAEPINASGEPESLIHPRRAAQATTAGAVNDRKPAMIPIQNARRSVTPELLELDPVRSVRLTIVIAVLRITKRVTSACTARSPQAAPRASTPIT